MAVAELCKRLCRYLLHRYLGPFLEEKVALDQLHLSLDKGTGTVTQLTLDAAHLNETLAKYHLPFSVLDGYIGSVTIHLPLGLSTASFTSVLSASAESFSGFGGLRLELSDVQFTIRGLDMTDTLLMGSSLDLLATSLCASEFAAASQSLAVDYSQSIFNSGIGIPLEGLDQLASVIDSIVSQIEIVVRDLIIRLEPPLSFSATGDDFSVAAIELHLQKASASLSSKDSIKEIGLSLANIEVRAETYADRKRAESLDKVDSYIILLRIPDANVSLSSSTNISQTFFAKVIASNLVTFFPGPEILCSVISMLDSIFNKNQPSKESHATIFESVVPGDVADPVMFESCAGSVISNDQFMFSNERPPSISPSVHLIVHIARTAVVMAYKTPDGPLASQNLSVAFFSGLPANFGSSCLTSRQCYAKCCPLDCLIVQFLSTKIDLVFNAHQTAALSIFEREGSQSTLRLNTMEWGNTEREQPLRMSLQITVDCFDISDCVRQQSQLNACHFVQLLSCDGGEDVNSALNIEVLVRFTGFREFRISSNKPAVLEFDLSVILGRVYPLASFIKHSLSLKRSINSDHQDLPMSSETFSCRFEKLRGIVRFPKPQPLSFIGGHDDFSLQPETFIVDMEKLLFQITSNVASPITGKVSRDSSVECFMLSGFFQIDPSHSPVQLCKLNSLKVDFLKSNVSQRLQHGNQTEQSLFADPPMRLHNGRELHVPTHQPLRFNPSNSVAIDILVFNMILPSAHVIHLLVDRFTELEVVFKAFKERKSFEEQQNQRMMEQSALFETAGDSIYYSMTASNENNHFSGMASQKKSSLHGSEKTVHCYSVRFEKFLVSASSIKNENNPDFPHVGRAKRGDLFSPNSLALIAFDLALNLSGCAGWMRIGSLSLIDAYTDTSNVSSPGSLEFFNPVIRSCLLPQATVSLSSTSHSVSSSDSSTTHKQTQHPPSLLLVWKNKRVAMRLSNISLDLCSSPGKIPSSIQIACDVAQSFEKEFQLLGDKGSASTPQSSIKQTHSQQQNPQNRWEFCFEANGLSIYIRSKTDQDLDGIGTGKMNSLPGLCLSFDNVLFDASPTSKIFAGPGQPPVGDMWLGIANTVLELCIKTQTHHEFSLDDSNDCNRREKIFQADWLEFTFGMPSSRGSTSFVDVCGSSVSISTTVNNLSALCALVATVVGGLKNSAQFGGNNNIGTPTQEEAAAFGQTNSNFETPSELKDALKESSYVPGTSPPAYSSQHRNSWSSPVSTGSARDSDDGDFLILSTSLSSKMKRDAECHKITGSSMPLKITDNFLAKPLFRPDPMSIQPHGWPTPTFRFTLRDTSVRCALMTERGDSLEINLIRLSFRYDRCPSWTPNMYRISAAIQDIEVLERHLDVGHSNPIVALNRLVADDVPKVHSAPHVMLKIAVVRPSSCAVSLLKQNAQGISKDSECDVRLNVQPIRIKASNRTIDLLKSLTSKFSGLSNAINMAATNLEQQSLPSAVPNVSTSPTPSLGVKSPAHHRHVGEMGRGAPILFDDRDGQQTTTPISSGVFIRSFAIQPNVLVELSYSHSITANVPLKIDKCRLLLPALSENRSGFADAGRLLDFVSERWKSAVSGQWSAIVTAGTGLNKLQANAQELISATTDLGALLLAPIYSDSLPPAMTVDSQLRPGRVLRGVTTSAASLSADVVMKLFSTAMPLLQHASAAASNLLNVNNPASQGGIPIHYQNRPSTPELKSFSNTSSSSSSLPSRERKTSRSHQDEALRKAANAALLGGQPIETAGTLYAHSFD